MPSPQALPFEGSTSSPKYCNVGYQTFSTWGFGDTEDRKCSSKHMVVSQGLHTSATVVMSSFPRASLMDGVV